MVELVTLECSRGLGGASERYDLLHRVTRVGRRAGVEFLAFGLQDRQVLLLMDGPHDAVGRVVMGVRRGTANRASRMGQELRLSLEDRREADDLMDAVVRCHGLGPPADPLARPWTSHRDLLDLRRAAFYDAAPLRARLDPRAVHRACGGRALPPGWPPPARTRASLGLLLRVAAAVHGHMPGDRRTFPIFVHLARLGGHSVREIAAALALTPRRIRQILGRTPDLLPSARAHLADPRLLHVP